MERVFRADRQHQTRGAGRRLDYGVVVLVGVQLPVLQSAHEPVENCREFFQPRHLLDACDEPRFVLGVLVVLAGLEVRVGLTDEG